MIGVPLLTGSEEGRGPLYDLTQTSFEGARLPIANPADPVQGRKLPAFLSMSNSVPKAVPLLAVRIGDGLIVSVPGEMTVAMGARIRDAALRIAEPSGVHLTVISGLANEYLQYFTTPAEYEMQHYEGGSDLYGQYSSILLQQVLLDLVRRLVRGVPAPAAGRGSPMIWGWRSCGASTTQGDTRRGGKCHSMRAQANTTSS